MSVLKKNTKLNWGKFKPNKKREGERYLQREEQTVCLLRHSSNGTQILPKVEKSGFFKKLFFFLRFMTLDFCCKIFKPCCLTLFRIQAASGAVSRFLSNLMRLIKRFLRAH